jgi:hypothetical protein
VKPHYKMVILPNKFAQTVMLLTCIREVSSSNFGQGTNYPHWGFSWFSSVPLNSDIIP